MDKGEKELTKMKKKLAETQSDAQKWNAQFQRETIKK